MRAYKGFDRDGKCRGFQFEEGKTYREENARLCECGFHACEMPLDCLRYYNDPGSIYRTVELDEISDEKSDDSKRVGKKITIGRKIDAKDLFSEHAYTVIEICNDPIHLKARKPDSPCAVECDGIVLDYDFSGAAAYGFYRTNYLSFGQDLSIVNRGDRNNMVSDAFRGNLVASGNHNIAGSTGRESNVVVSGNHSIAAAVFDYSNAISNGSENKAIVYGDNSTAVVGGELSEARAYGRSSAAVALESCNAIAYGACCAALALGTGSAFSQGECGCAVAIGDHGTAVAKCSGSMAVALGYHATASGAVGSWLVFAVYDRALSEDRIVDVKVACVDGEEIKPDTPYFADDDGKIKTFCF